MASRIVTPVLYVGELVAIKVTPGRRADFDHGAAAKIKLPQDAVRASGGASFLYRQLPYIVVLLLAISGVAYTNSSHQPLVG
jgi:hypothetical protein